MVLEVKKLREMAVMPARATDGSAGYDLHACLAEPVVIRPGELRKIPIGIAVALPDSNCAAFIYARSGLAIKHGIVPGNCVGVIDSDYRGEVIVGLYNEGKQDFTVLPGDRIAQMVIAPVFHPELVQVGELSETQRGEGGFGSTGVHKNGK